MWNVVYYVQKLYNLVKIISGPNRYKILREHWQARTDVRSIKELDLCNSRVSESNLYYMISKDEDLANLKLSNLFCLSPNKFC